MRLHQVCPYLTLAVPALLLASCGGGGGGGAAVAPQSTGPSTAWVQGQFVTAANYHELCVSPRSGTDPSTQKAYLDKQGDLSDELFWLRSWTHDLYLWYAEVQDQNPANFSADADYFKVLKTTATTVSNQPKDKFHFTYATPIWETLSQSGVQAGSGADFVIVAPAPPRKLVVGDTEAGSPAASPPANLSRGTAILTIDGVDVVNANDSASIDKLNAGLSPQTVGETHTFTVQDLNTTSSRTLTLMSASITSTPVKNVHSIMAPGGARVGYMLFNDHLATAEKELVAGFSQLQSAGVQDLVLDIRYNGGGYLDIASEVAYMIAGAAQTSGKTFELTQFNDKHPTTDPVTGMPITPVGFFSTTQGFSVAAGQALPTLNLKRVFVLTTASTCSASESIINSLRGIDIEVIQVGSTTCGKPYGFYPTDNCGITYFSIQFQGVNAKGMGGYSDGFSPLNTIGPGGVSLPGCSVPDDFSHALGDSAEGLLASALSYQGNGVCPVPPAGLSAGQPILSGTVVKSVWRQNRIRR